MPKNFNTRITHKIDTYSHWELAMKFIPLAGEIIVYTPDDENDTRLTQIKIGDGKTYVNDLKFLITGSSTGFFDDIQSDWLSVNKDSLNYIKNKPGDVVIENDEFIYIDTVLNDFYSDIIDEDTNTIFYMKEIPYGGFNSYDDIITDEDEIKNHVDWINRSQITNQNIKILFYLNENEKQIFSFDRITVNEYNDTIAYFNIPDNLDPDGWMENGFQKKNENLPAFMWVRADGQAIYCGEDYSNYKLKIYYEIENANKVIQISKEAITAFPGNIQYKNVNEYAKIKFETKETIEEGQLNGWGLGEDENGNRKRSPIVVGAYETINVKFNYNNIEYNEVLYTQPYPGYPDFCNVYISYTTFNFNIDFQSNEYQIIDEQKPSFLLTFYGEDIELSSYNNFNGIEFEISKKQSYVGIGKIPNQAIICDAEPVENSSNFLTSGTIYEISQEPWEYASSDISRSDYAYRRESFESITQPYWNPQYNGSILWFYDG